MLSIKFLGKITLYGNTMFNEFHGNKKYFAPYTVLLSQRKHTQHSDGKI